MFLLCRWSLPRCKSQLLMNSPKKSSPSKKLWTTSLTTKTSRMWVCFFKTCHLVFLLLHTRREINKCFFCRYFLQIVKEKDRFRKAPSNYAMKKTQLFKDKVKEISGELWGFQAPEKTINKRWCVAWTELKWMFTLGPESDASVKVHRASILLFDQLVLKVCFYRSRWKKWITPLLTWFIMSEHFSSWSQSQISNLL